MFRMGILYRQKVAGWAGCCSMPQGRLIAQGSPYRKGRRGQYALPQGLITQGSPYRKGRRGQYALPQGLIAARQAQPAWFPPN